MWKDKEPIGWRLLDRLEMEAWKSYELRFFDNFSIPRTRIETAKDSVHQLSVSIKKWAKIIWLANSNKDEIELLIDDSENIEFEEWEIESWRVKKTLKGTKTKVESIADIGTKHSPLKRKQKIVKIPMYQFMSYFIEFIDSFEVHEIWKKERSKYSKKTRDILKSRKS